MSPIPDTGWAQILAKPSSFLQAWQGLRYGSIYKARVKLEEFQKLVKHKPNKLTTRHKPRLKLSYPEQLVTKKSSLFQL